MLTCLDLWTVSPRPAMANSWLMPPYVCFLDIWVWSLVYADMDLTNVGIADPYRHLFVSWVSKHDCQIMVGSLDFESRPAMANSWLIPPSVCLIFGHLSVIVRSCSHVWRFGLWVPTIIAIAWLISPSVCFLDIWAWSLDHVHMGCLKLACIYNSLAY